jgi:deazaflavin-dependent oxidoreductase (nitroreductase family)
MSADAAPYVRPKFLMTYVVNPINRRLGLSPMLIVPGRRSGQLRTTPIGRPFQLADRRYLVSGRGETQWARNLRAAGRCLLRFHGSTESLRATEVDGAERDRVVAAYRRALGRSVDPYFRRIPDAADHPVFRLEPEAAARS